MAYAKYYVTKFKLRTGIWDYMICFGCILAISRYFGNIKTNNISLIIHDVNIWENNDADV